MLAETAAIEYDHRIPQIQLLDAHAMCIGDQALRNMARQLTIASGAVFVSRSYCFPYAIVAWHSGPVGVDIERISQCESAFADLICTRDERIAAGDASDFDAYLTSLWSSKEALAKGLGDALCYEPSRLESPLRWPLGCAGAWHSEELAVDRKHVAWLCWRSGRATVTYRRGERAASALPSQM